MRDKRFKLLAEKPQQQISRGTYRHHFFTKIKNKPGIRAIFKMPEVLRYVILLKSQGVILVIPIIQISMRESMTTMVFSTTNINEIYRQFLVLFVFACFF